MNIHGYLFFRFKFPGTKINLVDISSEGTQLESGLFDRETE